MSENSIPEGFKMTELGSLPEEWDVVRLGDVVKKTEQKDPKKSPGWRFKYIDVSSINNLYSGHFPRIGTFLKILNHFDLFS